MTGAAKRRTRGIEYNRPPMRAAIFAGGLGTRMRQLEPDLPKPLVTIGGLPILAHVISIYLRNGINDVLVLGGHRFDSLAGFFSALPRAASEPVQNGLRLREVRLADWPAFDLLLLDTGATTETGAR